MASETAAPSAIPPAAGGSGPTPLQELRRLDSTPRGLTDTEAQARLAEVGENVLPEARTASWARLFVRGLRDPFTTVLLCLGLVSATVNAWGTACVIFSLVVVSCVLRATGEHRADRSMAALRDLVAATATVLRRADPRYEPEGRAGTGGPPGSMQAGRSRGPGGARSPEGAGPGTSGARIPAQMSRSRVARSEERPPPQRETPAAELVPGDVIRLAPGDLVPADVRLLRANGLTVHQSALTGESAPVAKYTLDAPTASGGGPFDQPHLCFQGSTVVSGSGTALVLETGARTRFARAHGIRVRREPSAFDRSVHGISWVLIRFMLLTPPLILMADTALRGRGLETLPFAVAVAVGLTPEMLPVIVTTCLARGAALLARSQGVIVKRLPALHDLGAVDVLCLDKTGTLTQDRPVVERALDGAGQDAPDVLRWAAAGAWWTLQLADLPAPDALDEALLDAAEGAWEPYEGIDALPFDPVRRIATAVVRGRLGIHTLVVRGAPEAVLERCALEPLERERLLARAAREADDGLRLLAVATADRPARTRPYTPADARGLSFRGFVAFRDALAPTAAQALRDLAARGVTVKVLTGDHPGTAARACRDLGLDAGPVRTAGAADELDATVVARCTAEDKARIVAALRKAGHTVGFLGDGVNDAPALHAADVGIAPRDAAVVARERADIVLVYKDLTAIDQAVAAGRRSSGNIATYLRVTLSSNLGNVVAMLAAGLLLPFLPMLPVQVLAQNLCFDAAQLAFAHDRPAARELMRPTVLSPRDFLRFITGFGLVNAVADLATFGVLALVLYGPDALDDEQVFHSAWFTENLLTQALVMLLLRTGRRRAEGRAPGPVGRAAGVLSVIGILLPLTPLGALLGLSALPAAYYLLLGAVLALYASALWALRTRYEQRSYEGP